MKQKDSQTCRTIGVLFGAFILRPLIPTVVFCLVIPSLTFFQWFIIFFFLNILTIR